MSSYYFTTPGDINSHRQPISPKTATLFRENLPALLTQVRDTLRIASNSQTPPLLSEKQLDFVQDAQSYFGKTLAAIFTFSLYDVLAQELFELAHAFRSRGLDPGFPVRMLKAWNIAIHCILPTAEANEVGRPLEWLEKQAELIPPSAREKISPGIPQADFTRALLDNRKGQALEIALSFHKDHGLESTLDYLFLLSLSEIGRGWSDNRLSVAEEHLASANLMWAAHRFFAALTPHAARQTTVAVACVPGDLHTLGAELLARCLEYYGWPVLFLGAGMPETEMFDLLETRQPGAIIISIRMLAFLPALSRMVQCSRAKLPGMKILAGGTARAETILKTLCDGVPRNFTECRAMLEEKVNHATIRRV